MADEVTYDVFLSHNSQDKPQVEALAHRLGKRGLIPFLDRWCLVPGEPWQEAIEEALRASASCAVFLGPGDISPWHNEEMRAALDRQARERVFRVIPVLLPGATRPDEGDLPLFLGGRTWVDFRQVGLEDPYAFHCLCCGIQGIAPGPPPEAEPEEAAAIPPVRALPPGSYMPLPPSADFVGRVEELRTLARLLCDGGSTATVAVGQIAAATGLGGIGKTQLTVAFVHRYGYRFPGGVFWLDCGDPELIPDFVAACGGLQGMNLPGFEALSRPEQIARVRAEWRKPIPRLLVLDNVEEVEVLRRWRPPSGGCRLLITSRRGEWPTWMGVQPLAVGTLPRPESLELLCQPQLEPNQAAESCSLYHDPAANAVCELLDDLPLALHLAGCYLAHYGHEVSPAEYLEELRAAPLKHGSLRRAAGDVPSPTGHEQNVEATFQVSYRRLDADDPTDALARRLFVWAGHCAPGAPIPRDLLRRALPEEVADEKYLFADALCRLANLGLFQVAGDGDFQVHRLLAGFARDVGAEEEAEVAGTLAQAVAEMATEANESGLPARMRPLLPHLRQVAATAESDSELAAALYANIGGHLQIVADYTGARPYFERALAIDEKVLGGEHPDTANSLNNLGSLLQDMGDLAGARPYYERALAIREKVLGAEHPHTARSLNNLGTLLQDTGDLAGARPYYERALAIREKVLGGEHPDTATSLNNLGTLLKAMGDLAGARHYLERALAIHEKVLGGEHPDTAGNLNSLGLLLRAMGDLAGARPYYERALAIREKVLGGEHPDTAGSLNSLGLLLQAMGDLAGARPYLERALAIHEKVLGGEHPNTALSLNNLGSLLQAMGDLAEARPYLERALAIHEKVLGGEHPNTATSLNNLGYLLQDMGDLAGARPYLERALAIHEKVLGGEHPDTATSLNNLGGLLQAMGDLAGARAHYERALAIWEKVLGGEHPDTATSLNNLGALLRAMGDLAGARAHYERALQIFRQSLGEDHPHTVTVRGNLESLGG
jgi:tetratricopeptide (TPR) repeat protein